MEDEVGTGNIHDLATLHTLDENGLLEEIKARHQRDVIYTYIGDILIAVNPYKEVPIYDSEYQNRYRGLKERGLQPPHIFAVSDNVYQSLVNTGSNQCCVVSGESGAGKTESTKYMVKHIASLCQHETSDLHERIVQVNPLLEAFGNAQTVINNNSSRFGKYIELTFNADGGITGAHISEYLLEKSRVVSQALGERNFHIFYYLFAGLSPELLQANRLTDPASHRIMLPVDKSPVFKTAAEEQRYKDSWEELQRLFKNTGFKEEQLDAILATLAGILHLSDIEFEQDDDTTHDGVMIKNEESMEMAAELLLVDKQTLTNALISNIQTLTTGEKITQLKNLTQANDGRDALAKALYGRMFGWTVRQINMLLKPDVKGRRALGHTIGILDLAGFENFQNNSFEQLCINVANEQLHFYFNQHIFLWEMEEYKKEGIEGKDIKFVDNRGILELFMTPNSGLFAKLDEQLRVPAATDRTFIDKITGDYGNNKYFKRPKGQTLNFVITHYAGQVIYNVDNFLEKNRDTLSVNLMDCMKQSESQFVTELFYAPVTETGSMRVRFDAPSRSRMSVLLSKQPKLLSTPASGGGGKSNRFSRTASTMAKKQQPYVPPGTVGRKGMTDAAGRTMASHFSTSLTDLMQKLNSGEPHFIRCIKPNASKFPEVFQDDLVLQQLRYTGVLETVKIRRQGYATRLSFELFLKRYKSLCFGVMESVDPTPSNCGQVLKKADLKDYEIGHTKVFLRYWHTEQLQVQMERMTQAAITCQKAARMFLAKRLLVRLKQQAKKEAEMIRKLCEDVSRMSEEIYKLQCEQCEFDRKEHQRKEEERRERERKEREERERKEREEKKRKEEQEVKARKEREKRENEEQERKRAEQLEAERLTQLEKEKASERTSNAEPSNEAISEAIGLIPVDLESDIPPVPPPPAGIVSQSKQFIWELLQEAMERYSQLSNQIWAKVFYLEKGELVGKVYLRDWDVIINNTDVKYDGKVIGLKYENFDNPVRDWDSSQVLDQIAEGIEIARDEEGSILMRNLSNQAVIAKDYTNPAGTCLSPDIVDAFGQIPRWPVKIFDMSKFKQQVAQELQKPEISVGHLQMLSIVSFAFGRNSMNDFTTPSWMFIINFAALELLGDEGMLQELLRQGQVSVSGDQQVKLRRDWANMYRPRRQSTDSIRQSMPSYQQEVPEGTIGPAFMRKASRSDESDKGTLREKLNPKNLFKKNPFKK